MGTPAYLDTQVLLVHLDSLASLVTQVGAEYLDTLDSAAPVERLGIVALLE